MSDDIKRFEEYTTSFEKAAIILGALHIILAIWARAAHFEVNPASLAGISGVAGFNVVHGILFGPIIILLSLSYYLSLLTRREALRCAIFQKVASPTSEQIVLSAGDWLVLTDFRSALAPWTFANVVDRLVRRLWFFLVPPIVAAVLLRRYCDLLPNAQVVPTAESKTWSLWERIKFLFGSFRGWEMQPILPDRYVESDPVIASHLPYIYPPYQSWIYTIFLILCCVMAWRASKLYFASGLTSTANGVK